MNIIQTVKDEYLKVQPRGDNSLYIDGSVGVYSEFEGCISTEHIKGTVEVVIEGDKISYISSDNLELISSEYDGSEWEDIILELEDILRTCFKVISD